MTIDASAVARVLGIETQYQDMRAGAVLFLPQQIAVFAQGSSAASFSLEKWVSTGASAGGSRFGFGCPIHLILRELQPANGDGVGTIPVIVYPLDDDPSGVAASGSIVPSGMATRAASFRIRVAGILSQQFVIPAGAVNVSATIAKMATAIAGVLEMPVTTAHTYGTITSQAKAGGNTGNGTITAMTAPGTPLPGVWQLRNTQAVANGGVFTLTDPSGGVVSSSVTMTPGAGGATVINAGGLQFTLTDGSTDFALGDGFDITVPATDIDLVAKWTGASGNAIKIEVIGDLDAGVTFTITQPTGGLVNPSVADAIARVGGTWATMCINAAPIEDTTILDQFNVWGEGRWGELVRKPTVVFTGVTHETVSAATAVSSVRRTDRINAQLVAPGSPNLPFVVAARQLARIAKVANNNPPTDYGSQKATGLIPGEDADQWDFASRDLAVKAGSSTIEVKDGVINISDVVTMYRPTGEEPPAYRFVKDIVRLQTIIYNLDLEFGKPEWDGAPLIPDDQATANPNARKPGAAKAAAAAIVDSLALQAIISDPATTKKNITCVISSSNPNRWDMVVPVQLSGNSNIKGVLLKFGFFFGTPLVLS